MRLSLIVSALIISVVLVAQNNNYSPDPTWKVPAKAAQAHNPLGSSKSAAQHGHEIYEAQCSMCHGSDGKGLSNAANFRLPAVQAQSDGVLFWKITNGHPGKGMPSFKVLSDNDRWCLVSYLRKFKADNNKVARP